MSLPRVCLDCDKCGTKYDVPLNSIGNMPYEWMPKGWCIHDTQDGQGPEPSKLYVLCDKCETKFQNSVRSFKV